ncbi:E3 ubiquitin-protein ligase ATL6-like [Apium graveolens]|uniref:E3 ubiquitin-protein ligase ATL6-like n=1 Tax=Apium graveolens TaxID=4045 RepID=UPI003D7A5E57
MTAFKLVLFFIFTAISIVNGQGSASPGTPTDPYGYAKFSPSMAIIIAVLITALFFMGFFSIYVRRWSQSGTGGSVRATLSMRARRAAAARGLDATAIDALPTLAYSEVKDLHIGKGALECAVCLNEFEDDETLRLLPKCDHVFHLECIDMWLASHTTCPVCRADLAANETVEPVEVSDEIPVSGMANDVDNVAEPQGEVHVTIEPDESQERPTNNLLQLSKPDMMNRTGSLRVNRPPRSGSVRSGSVRSKLFSIENIFPRSHSTGHSLVQTSLVQPGENVDRYTLRLPEELRNAIIKRSLNRTGSVAGEGSVKKGNKTGTNEEGSSRGKTIKRLGSLERVGKSDRWNFARMPSFLSRALSTRSKVVAGDGEPSTSAQPSGNDGSVKGKGSEPGKLPV